MRNPRRLDPVAVAQLKRSARCPDCNSTVRLLPDEYGPGTHKLEVRHDDSCPNLAGLRRAGRDAKQIAFAQTEGQSLEAFAMDAMRAAALLSQQTGRQIEIRAAPYADEVLGVADGATFRTSPRGSRGTGRGRGERR